MIIMSFCPQQVIIKKRQIRLTICNTDIHRRVGNKQLVYRYDVY